ncbi:MAG: hypothetical protein PHR06_09565 [Candidatus Cloacimonetes bacterium]|nr:hypothetical protein [Candidatus Cloacimonadota bacterium]
MNRFLLSLFLGLQLIFIGCSSVYFPVESEQIKVQDHYAIIETPKHSLIVSYEYWLREPQRITDYYTTFYVTVINKTDEMISVDITDFTVLDENNYQYDLIEPELVLDLFSDNEFYFMREPSLLDQSDDMFSRRIEAQSNIARYSFSFGKIVSHAQKSGYIFVNKIPAANRKIKLIYRDLEANFEKK